MTFFSGTQTAVWAAEDFISQAPRVEAYRDPWLQDSEVANKGQLAPTAVDVLVATPPVPSVESWVWGLDSSVTPASLLVNHGEAEDWWLDAPRPFLGPKPRENPFVIDLRPGTPESLFAKRARWLVSLLDIAEPRRRRSHIRFFEQLFADFEHVNTFSTLTRLALDERVNADDLVDACRFRVQFLERPGWWAVRSAGFLHYANSGSGLLGWSRALQFVRLCDGDPVSVIEDDWIDGWMDLPIGDPARWRFVDYIEAKLERYSDGVWDNIPQWREIDRTPEWRREHGMAAASAFARTATLIGLNSPRETSR